MRQILIITADTNDADYVNRIIDSDHDRCFYLEESNIIRLKRIAEVVNDSIRHHNWCTGEYVTEIDTPKNMYKDILTQGDIDFFTAYTPYAEHGIHTITSIQLLTISDEEEIL